MENEQAHLQGLNPQQLEAVLHKDGPILVLAGAGSGKTRVLTRRVSNLILNHKINSYNILAVTFTNKAAGEMSDRLKSLLGPLVNDLWVTTFHSAALRILRRSAEKLGYSSNFVVYDDQDSKSLIKQVLKSLEIDEKKYPVYTFQSMIDRAKNNFQFPKDLDSGFKKDAEVYEQYQKLLRSANAMDFGDLLMNVVRLFKEFPEALDYYRNKFKYVLVDEFQDTNKVQYDFIRYLVSPNYNLLAVGDDDQSIYGFRGANIENILRFEKDFSDSKVVKLEQNYRSTQNILELANSIISKNKERKDKALWTDLGDGALINTFVGRDETEEAEFIAREIARKMASKFRLSDVAIFYRTNAQSRAIEEALVQAGISYKIFGGLKFYDRAEIKDTLAYLKLILNPSDRQGFLRIINTPTRGIGAKTVSTIIEKADQENISLLEAASRMSDNSKIKRFTDLMEGFTAKAKTYALSELIATILDDTGYNQQLKISKDLQSESRIENLQELIAIAHTLENEHDDSWQCLEAFLDRVALASSADILGEEGQAVSLMTLHLAKGLEFQLVFLTGLEEGLLPHSRSKDNPKDVEEERRLCYVGVTRARQELYLTRAKRRGMFGSYDYSGLGVPQREPSRFIYDMPEKFLTSLGGDFFSDQNSFSGYDEEPVFSWEQKIKPAKFNKPKASFSNIVVTADDLDAVDLSHLEKVAPQDLHPGLKIIHPYLGRGEILEVQGDPEANPHKAKVTINFSNETKKLIWSKANLHLDA